jgi:hypothetical protein
MANKERVIPYTTESEYYPDGTQKRYYQKVEQPYPQVFQLIVGLSLVAIALCTLTITYQLLEEPRQCDENYNQTT